MTLPSSLRRLARAGALAAAAFGALATAPRAVAAESAPPRDPLAARGWNVTGGAAPGYVDDRACEPCHQSIWTSYQEVAMSKAFYPATPDRVVERLGERFYHEPSQRYYEMKLVDGRYRFERYQLDDTGRPINVLRQRVDWILGSGNHSRTYLFRTEAGELFQLPLAWYSQTDSWGMAPGYDRPHHLGVQRMVRRECMFCHNAFPNVAAGSDAYDAPHRFPEELPSGLGCQRCHGPGALHASLALTADVDLALAAIVNPGKLEPELRDDICYGCHLQPSVALAGVRRFGRTDYSFRPGQPLHEYLIQIDVVEQARERSERFQINHHPYRLRQSRCFQESAGLSCVTCHDPHSKVPVEERPAWYGARCRSCHDLAATAAHRDEDPGYCVPCHMPERRTQDVVQVTMTDHRIQRGPVGPELLAPLVERDPVIVDAHYLDPAYAPDAPLDEIYRATTVVRAGGGANASAVERLETLLARAPRPELPPWLNLAVGQLAQRDFAALEATTAAIFRRSPGHPTAMELLGLAHARRGTDEEAIAWLRRAAAVPRPRAEAPFNLGVVLTRARRYEEALQSLETAVAIRPTSSAAWYYVGEAHAALARPQQAAAAYRRALALDPGLERAYVRLGETLLALGDEVTARRYLSHGTRVARNPQPVAEALERLVDESPD